MGKSFSLFLAFSFFMLLGCSEKVKLVKIPELNTKGSVYKGLGTTDPKLYDKTEGAKITAVLYVDFPNVAGKGDTAELTKQLTAGNKASDWFKNQSHGKMTMTFENPVKGWRRMSKKVERYKTSGDRGHQRYIQEAVNLHPKVDFSKVDYIVVVCSLKTFDRDLIGTACFNGGPGNGIKTKQKEFHHAVTFGDCDFGKVTFYTLIHELGHAMSLPDTYDYSIDGPRHLADVGAWDLMNSTHNGVNFLGWHRHKLGWLSDKRKTYFNKGSLEVTLTPLSSDKGLSFIVIPIDDAKKPSKVFVIELALPIRRSYRVLGEKPYGEGVLIYTVDANRSSGRRPLVVYPKDKASSRSYSYIYKAPFLEGDRFENKKAPFTLEVLKKDGKNYKIKITKK
jgi:M6 family metalloprotease-like protein